MNIAQKLEEDDDTTKFVKNLLEAGPYGAEVFLIATKQFETDISHVLSQWDEQTGELTIANSDHVVRKKLSKLRDEKLQVIGIFESLLKNRNSKNNNRPD